MTAFYGGNEFSVCDKFIMTFLFNTGPFYLAFLKESGAMFLADLTIIGSVNGCL